jgi:hypothetical protein
MMRYHLALAAVALALPLMACDTEPPCALLASNCGSSACVCSADDGTEWDCVLPGEADPDNCCEDLEGCL